ncbi:ATP F0F1 synthase subunit B [Brevirhabdus pacifica]|uniref:ATP synthase subunit b n=1 Tax=Brevirhabdus pacifica TaxID=1267768 RepID=A0A1U7DHZ8_9RHOB|nr:F0F1 ATP synthase subunit B [Brevirhabdus pacifica]APX89612.1 ATP F0F1 synthase subunit B [Brevirhabdus pacifica]OWU74275.1 ATP F0F1 synthase subunit B [Loktanella sp. 22II-4b]PJJ85716.1 F-type H+-transporting ATPase subunit b [Brevirhabdus pacifica]
MKHAFLSIPATLAALAAAPAHAASGPFFSLYNTDFVVLIAFVLFLAVLFYFKVPSKVGAMLDKRAVEIRSELDEAKALREEAQTLLASYERKQKEVEEQSRRIVETARTEAQAAAEQAKEDIRNSIARRLKGAEDQIASAEAKVIRDMRDRAVTVAIAAATEVISKKMGAAEGNALIDQSVRTVEAKLH